MEDNRLKELEGLIKSTFDLWDEKRVGFSWRHYYLNHTMRVRNLSVSLGEDEGGDIDQLKYAATLHDITKRYDGPVSMDENGNRLLNEDGFWLNDPLLPTGNNIVTQLYEKYKLFGEIHHVSGAFISEEILRMRNFSETFCQKIADIIVGHLKSSRLSPDDVEREYSSLEKRILYDADTIDANIGLVAFFRNVQIRAYSVISRGEKVDLLDYVEGLADWVQNKDSFVNALLTVSAGKLATARQNRSKTICLDLDEETKSYSVSLKFGLLGIIDYFISCADDPNLNEQMDYLENVWLPQKRDMLEKEKKVDQKKAEGCLKRAISFCSLMRKEIEGEI